MAKYELVHFPEVDLTKEEEKRWSDKAFAPLQNFLKQEMPTVREEIISTVMYMGSRGRCGNDKFYYKNSLTRTYIVFDQAGGIVEQAEDSLYFL